MATTINGLLKIKQGAEYVGIHPRTKAEQVEGLNDSISDIIDPIRTTRALFTSNNPIIPKGRLAIETDLGGIKIGDGATRWKGLDYIKIDISQLVNFAESVSAQVAPIKKTRAEFTSENSVIANNIFAIETDQGGVKIGNGTDKWSNLPYIGGLTSNDIPDLFNPVKNTRQGFTNSNPVIPKGCLAIETDEGGVKIGDGHTAWGNLSYVKFDADTVVGLAAFFDPVKKTRAEFTSENPTIGRNILAIETDYNRIKIGDGSTKWKSLPYIGQEGDVIYIKVYNTTTNTYDYIS